MLFVLFYSINGNTRLCPREYCFHWILPGTFLHVNSKLRLSGKRTHEFAQIASSRMLHCDKFAMRRSLIQNAGFKKRGLSMQQG
jgi:hypothetical protein